MFPTAVPHLDTSPGAKLSCTVEGTFGWVDRLHLKLIKCHAAEVYLTLLSRFCGPRSGSIVRPSLRGLIGSTDFSHVDHAKDGPVRAAPALKETNRSFIQIYASSQQYTSETRVISIV